MVVAADFQINIHRDAVVGLRQRIKKLMQVNRLVFFDSLLKHIANQHLADGKIGRQFNQINKGQFIVPVAIVEYLGRIAAFKVKDFGGLALVVFGIF